jgi:hypothetical protein
VVEVAQELLQPLQPEEQAQVPQRVLEPGQPQARVLQPSLERPVAQVPPPAHWLVD